MKEGGIAEVKAQVIQPLLDLGMRKPRNRSAEAHAAWLEAVALDLVWVGREWHAPLVEVIRRNAEAGRARADGKAPRDLWPSRAAILNWAEDLTGRPRLFRLTVSYMQSQAGREAWARGPEHASRLVSYLERHGRPPSDGAEAMIFEEAEGLAARLSATRARVAAGRPLPGEAERLAAWERRVAWLRELVEGRPASGPCYWCRCASEGAVLEATA